MAVSKRGVCKPCTYRRYALPIANGACDRLCETLRDHNMRILRYSFGREYNGLTEIDGICEELAD